MKIHFKVDAILTVEQLIELHKQEDVGWDRRGGSSHAMLVFPKDGRLIEHRAYNFSTADLVDESGKVTVGGRVYEVSRFQGPTWVTCWGGYTYTQIENKIWVYEGALNGFVAQNLIPPAFKESWDKIVSCEGRYGKFEGPDSLSNYRRLRENWRSVWQNLLSGTLLEDERCHTPEVGQDQVLCKEHTIGEVADLIWDRITRPRDSENMPNPAIQFMGLQDAEFDPTPILKKAHAAIQGNIEGLALRARRR